MYLFSLLFFFVFIWNWSLVLELRTVFDSPSISISCFLSENSTQTGVEGAVHHAEKCSGTRLSTCQCVQLMVFRLVLDVANQSASASPSLIHNYIHSFTGRCLWKGCIYLRVYICTTLNIEPTSLPSVLGICIHIVWFNTTEFRQGYFDVAVHRTSATCGKLLVPLVTGRLLLRSKSLWR